METWFSQCVVNAAAFFSVSQIDTGACVNLLRVFFSRSTSDYDEWKWVNLLGRQWLVETRLLGINNFA